jgi:hypothetical protein
MTRIVRAAPVTREPSAVGRILLARNYRRPPRAACARATRPMSKALSNTFSKAGIHPPDQKLSNQAPNVVGWASRSKERRKEGTTTCSVRLNLSHATESKDVEVACTRIVSSKKTNSAGSISTAQRRDAEVSNIAATFRPLMDPRQLVVADLETMVVARSPVGHHGT